ncbi:BCL2/adenovirus E1B 19 kDa protein-interacting protein 2 [Heterocephalus glaber]|uniref:BCL2/adenovirus E1B 19 kDa protein-interacting protein 2 n=1 Tax=Heterocephalus glaber TaxID=10181 RepID=G5BYL0_HETGA|nr:BCL2/adenovirus E1B 19 kDa protein-interacting protein 2 [Heterocephalus glaber]
MAVSGAFASVVGEDWPGNPEKRSCLQERWTQRRFHLSFSSVDAERSVIGCNQVKKLRRDWLRTRLAEHLKGSEPRNPLTERNARKTSALEGPRIVSAKVFEQGSPRRDLQSGRQPWGRTYPEDVPTHPGEPKPRKKPGEQAPLGAIFRDLAVSPTSPAWRGEEDDGAEASSGGIGSLDYQEFVVDIESSLRMEGVELKEERQDEDFPIPLPEDDSIEADILGVPGPENQPDSPEVNGNKRWFCVEEIDLDGLDSPLENSNEFEWEDDVPKPKTTEIIRKGSITEYTAAEEQEDGRRWRMFRIGEQDHRVDMKAIEPYKKAISHGGYYGDGLNAIVVFAVCFMPESGQPNYRHLMDNLFKYVIGTLELLVAENYMIVYLNGATTRRKMPSLGWFRKCYQQIDRRLRKNLKSLIIVQPSWFIRTLLPVTRPFISSKFNQKIRYIFNLAELAELVPMEYVGIPECIKQVDQELNGKQDEPKSEQQVWPQVKQD